MSVAPGDKLYYYVTFIACLHNDNKAAFRRNGLRDERSSQGATGTDCDTPGGRMPVMAARRPPAFREHKVGPRPPPRRLGWAHWSESFGSVRGWLGCRAPAAVTETSPAVENGADPDSESVGPEPGRTGPEPDRTGPD